MGLYLGNNKIAPIVSVVSSAESEFIRQFTTRTDMQGMFRSCAELVTVPTFDTSNATRTDGMFRECYKLETVPALDTRNATNMQYMFYNCERLVSVEGLDARNCTNLSYMFHCFSSSFAKCILRNIKASVQVGSGGEWGKLLTQENALFLCKECRTVASKQTITFARAVYDNLETLYVKLIPITDDMRAEDDLIDEKMPFELCESTDDGSMTIANYMTLKNWAIAK